MFLNAVCQTSPALFFADTALSQEEPERLPDQLSNLLSAARTSFHLSLAAFTAL